MGMELQKEIQAERERRQDEMKEHFNNLMAQMAEERKEAAIEAKADAQKMADVVKLMQAKQDEQQAQAVKDMQKQMLEAQNKAEAAQKESSKYAHSMNTLQQNQEKILKEATAQKFAAPPQVKVVETQKHMDPLTALGHGLTFGI